MRLRQQELSNLNHGHATLAAPILVKKCVERKWEELLGLIKSGEDATVPDQAGRLPLHCALQYQAPLNIILALLAVFPEGPSVPDKRLGLPLHRGLRANAPEEGLMHVLNGFPEACCEQDSLGELPIHRALISGASASMTLSILAANMDGCQLMCNEEGLPLHCALKYNSPTKVVLAVFEAYPLAVGLMDQQRLLPINHLVPSCPGGPNPLLQEVFGCSRGDWAPFMDAWLAPSANPCSCEDVEWMLQRQLIQSRHVRHVIGMLLQERSEQRLGSQLRRIVSLMKRLVVTCENPIRAVVTIEAILRKRSKTCKEIKDNVREHANEFNAIMCRLMSEDAMEKTNDIFQQGGNSEVAMNSLLLADEPPHCSRLASLFDGGPIALAIVSKNSNFISQPAVHHLIKQSWYGGDWAFPLLRALYGKCQRDGMKQLTGLKTADAVMLLQELAQPSYMQATPVVRFMYEFAADLVFVASVVYNIYEDKPERQDYLSKDASFLEVREWSLVCFMIGHCLFEIGQMRYAGFKNYAKDLWNYIDWIQICLFVYWFGIRLEAAYLILVQGETDFSDKNASNSHGRALLQGGGGRGGGSASGTAGNPSKDFDSSIQNYETNGEVYRLRYTAFQTLSVVAIFMVFRLLSVAALNKKLGILVLMIMRMIKDLGTLMLLWIIIQAGFGTAMWALFSDYEGFYYFTDVQVTLFSAVLGDFDFLPFQENADLYDEYDSRFWLGIFLMILFLVLTNVLLLNLVIARLSATFERLQSSANQQWCLLMARIVDDCHGPRSMFCLVPPPFNILLVAIYTTLFLCFGVFYRLKRSVQCVCGFCCRRRNRGKSPGGQPVPMVVMAPDVGPDVGNPLAAIYSKNSPKRVHKGESFGLDDSRSSTADSSSENPMRAKLASVDNTVVHAPRESAARARTTPIDSDTTNVTRLTTKISLLVVDFCFIVLLNIPALTCTHIALYILWARSILNGDTHRSLGDHMSNKVLVVLITVPYLVLCIILSPFLTIYLWCKGAPEGTTQAMRFVQRMETGLYRSTLDNERIKSEIVALNLGMARLFDGREQLERLRMVADAYDCVDFRIFWCIVQHVQPVDKFLRADEEAAQKLLETPGDERKESAESVYFRRRSTVGNSSLRRRSSAAATRPPPSSRKKKDENLSSWLRLQQLKKPALGRPSRGGGRDTPPVASGGARDTGISSTGGPEESIFESIVATYTTRCRQLSERDFDVVSAITNDADSDVLGENGATGTKTSTGDARRFRDENSFAEDLFSLVVSLQQAGYSVDDEDRIRNMGILNVDDFLGDLVPFLPVFPIAFVRQSVFHLTVHESLTQHRMDAAKRLWHQEEFEAEVREAIGSLESKIDQLLSLQGIKSSSSSSSLHHHQQQQQQQQHVRFNSAAPPSSRSTSNASSVL